MPPLSPFSRENDSMLWFLFYKVTCLVIFASLFAFSIFKEIKRSANGDVIVLGFSFAIITTFLFIIADKLKSNKEYPMILTGNVYRVDTKLTPRQLESTDSRRHFFLFL